MEGLFSCSFKDMVDMTMLFRFDRRGDRQLTTLIVMRSGGIQKTRTGWMDADMPIKYPSILGTYQLTPPELHLTSLQQELMNWKWWYIWVT